MAIHWIPALTRLRRDLECPQEDKNGVPLSNSNVVSGPNSDGDLNCTYAGGAGECDYVVHDGRTITSGSAACPALPSQSSPTSPVQAVTHTQTAIVTQTAISGPPAPAASSSPVAPHTSSMSTSSAAIISGPSPNVTAQPVLESASRIELGAGSIAGITITAIVVLILGLGLIFCIRRASRRRGNDLEADITAYPPTATAPSERGSISTVAQSRQEYLMAQVQSLQKRLEAQTSAGNGNADLEEAMEQNEALRVRIRMLEGEMESQWGRGLTDNPPGYLE
ncbi:hypothetical protein B0H16DRAFT_323962 [Mycena metata]|uniref:Uncharacterized protein n=1 Tax=Mycena metata TaxID=1033252 RepID=A0AAD7MMG1_9AGAR|nr:hypothetical protein B0H16DRAFT_323962 [Mycena metata]